MNNINKVLLILLVLLFSITFSGMAGAQELKGKGTISGDIFEKKGRYYHAFLSVYGAYDDNIFNVNEETESDFITVISPRIQLVFPSTRIQPVSVNTATTTAGGLVYDRFEAPGFQQFQSYLVYSPQIYLYAENDDENTVNHEAQAALEYNLKGGLSFNLLDRMVQDFDRYEFGVSTETDTFRSNLASLIVSYDISEKTMVRFDYSNFIVSYTDDKNEDRNRIDNTASAYLFFKVKSKTFLFAQYTFIDVGYDEVSFRNSQEQNALAGVNWNMTDKTRASARVGYSLREFDDSRIEDGEGVVFQARVNYQATVKTSLFFSAYHRNEETPDLSYDYVKTSSATAAYGQNIYDKYRFELTFTYRDEDYQSDLTGAVDRSDQVFLVEPSLSYTFRDWLSFGLSYGYRNRSSNIETFDYDGSRVVLEIRGAI